MSNNRGVEGLLTCTSQPLCLDDYPEFCQEILSINSKNFEIGFHGLYHGVPHKSNNDEFRGASYNETVKIIEGMREVAKKTKIPFKNILRPPAWRMSPESIKACADHGIEILALSSDMYHDGSLDYKGEDKKFKNVVYYNCCPPSKELKFYKKTEIVYHACEWDSNFLNEKLKDDLVDFLNSEKENVKFAFMDAML
tara:strand:- start:119 stop:706 length:588 start_codon:yes stop_codon:yes gene_type:complete